METWAQWIRSKFDTVLLVLILAWLMFIHSTEYHEVLGAILLALTGARNAARAPDPPPSAPAPQPTAPRGQE